ncbi:MAG: type II secretion system F family protein [Alphaproteobacteria bacterium]|nr:type II secretion system F family protein [Alphaproteobacteria bacterium]
MNRLEIFYAKMVCRFSNDKRISIWRKLVSLLKNDFTLVNALNRLQMIESHGGAKPNEPFAICMREWEKNLERGLSFSEATRGWVPAEETLLLTSGNMSSLIVALENVGRIIVANKRIGGAVFSAIAYPTLLLVLVFAIIIMVGLYLVPPLSAVAGEGMVWSGGAASLIWLSNLAGKYWQAFSIVFVAMMFLIWWSLPRFSGRIRVILDALPPWNIYKIRLSVSWMMSLSAMVAAGVTIPDAMRMLADNSNRYLRRILEETLHYIANGDNLGNALQNTGMDFPNNELIGDLTIYADMNDFDENLTQISNDYLENSVKKIESVSETLNTIGILLISGVIAWIVLGTFQMQDQITAFLS